MAGDRSILSQALFYCADCGGKLYCHRTDNGKAKGKFTCGNYPAKKCQSGHRMDADDLVEIVCCTLKAIKDYIQVDEEQFLRTVEEAVNSQQSQDVKVRKSVWPTATSVLRSLKKLLCKIYEDNCPWQAARQTI
jgi:site-specific DNA recombinase